MPSKKSLADAQQEAIKTTSPPETYQSFWKK
jgi:hypothetical protein